MGMKQWMTFGIKTEGTEKAAKDINKVAGATDEVGDSAAVGSAQLDKMSGGAITAFSGIVAGAKKSVIGMKTLRGAVMATGIGALVIAVIALAQAFTSSEEGQNRAAKIMGVIGNITSTLTDGLAILGEGMITAFSNPLESIQTLATMIKENIVNRFMGLLELVPAIGDAIVLVFKGEWTEAAKVATDAVAKVTLGVEDFTDKAVEAAEAAQEWIEKQVEEGRIAASIADKRAKADKIDRANIVARAQADKEIADLRFKSEQREKFSALERMKFLEEASAKAEEITNKEIASARLRFQAKKAENKLSKSTKEDKDEEAQLEATLIALETKKLNLQKRLQTSITTFRNEDKAARAAEKKAKEKEAADAEIAAQKEIEDRATALLALEMAMDTQEEAELRKNKEKYDKLYALAELYEQDTTALKEQEEAERAAINKKYIKVEEVAEEMSWKTKVKMGQQALGALVGLMNAFAGEDKESQKKSFQRNKKLSIAMAAINTGQAVVNALTAGGNPLKLATGAQFVDAGVAAIVGATQIANISKTRFDSGGDVTEPPPADNSGGFGGGGGGGVAASAAQTPQLDLGFLGAGAGMGNIQAYVISEQVTTQQQADQVVTDQTTL